MEESRAARRWVIAGAVLQIFIGGFEAILGIIYMLDFGLRRIADPNDPSLPLLELIASYLILGALIGLILLILWFVFATNPSRFQKALVVTGIIGIVMSGILPGLLVFIGGRRAKRQEKSSASFTADEQ